MEGQLEGIHYLQNMEIDDHTILSGSGKRDNINRYAVSNFEVYNISTIIIVHV